MRGLAFEYYNFLLEYRLLLDSLRICWRITDYCTFMLLYLIQQSNFSFWGWIAHLEVLQGQVAAELRLQLLRLWSWRCQLIAPSFLSENSRFESCCYFWMISFHCFVPYAGLSRLPSGGENLWQPSIADWSPSSQIFGSGCSSLASSYWAMEASWDWKIASCFCSLPGRSRGLHL